MSEIVEVESKPSMKFICAGQWKTATKSASSALRILGYRVADFMDTFNTSLSVVWLDYLDGKIGIDKVVAEYEKLGFDANQDIPGNYQWEELYDYLGPDTKGT